MKPWIAGLDHGLSTVDIYSKECIGMFCIIPTLYYGLLVLYKTLGWWDGRLTKYGTPIRNMVAYEFAFGIPCCWFSYHGICLWLGWNEATDLYTEPLVSDRYYGQSDYVVRNLLWPMFIYQIWNTIYSVFLIKDLCRAEMYGHHIVTAFVQYLGLNGFMNYHAYFFIGLVEISNVFLTIVDIPRFVPEFSGNWPILHKTSQLGFITSFILLRMILWPCIAVPVIRDLIFMLRDSTAHSESVVSLFILATLALTYLQFKWGWKIAQMGWQIVTGKSIEQAKDHDKKQ